MNSAVLALALLTPAAPPSSSTPDVSENVRKGLEWLAKQQKPNGSWTLSTGNAPTRVTTMAGLAFLMQGSTLKHGTYAPNLQKAVDWIEKNVAVTKILGRDRGADATVMRDHVHAILFLVSVYDVDDDAERKARIAKILDKAIADAVKAQTKRGGWYVFLDLDAATLDMSECTADVLHALLAARKAGFTVPKKAIDAGFAYLTKATNREGGVVASLSGADSLYGSDGRGGHRIAAYNAAAAALMLDGERPDTLSQWVKYTVPESRQQMPTIRDGGVYIVLQQFQAARACFLLGENGHRRLDPKIPAASLVKWSEYRTTLFKALKDAQRNDGSWVDNNSGSVNPTSYALVILQLDNEYLPAFAR